MTIARHLEKSTGAPVIDFAIKAAPGRSPRRRVVKRPDHPADDLIMNCIEYGMQIAAGRAAYEIDPTDANFASHFDDLSQSRADRALRAALDTQPLTLDGLRAKAALVNIALKDWETFDDVLIDELRKKFLISLADDIIRFQRSAMSEKTSNIPIGEPRA
jgi:hypothetical protein